MGALCTEFVKLSVGVGRRWREERRSHKLGGSSLLSEVSTDTFQSLALSHRGTALLLNTATNTNTGSRKLGAIPLQRKSPSAQRGLSNTR